LRSVAPRIPGRWDRANPVSGAAQTRSVGPRKGSVWNVVVSRCRRCADRVVAEQSVEEIAGLRVWVRLLLVSGELAKLLEDAGACVVDAAQGQSGLVRGGENCERVPVERETMKRARPFFVKALGAPRVLAVVENGLRAWQGLRDLVDRAAVAPARGPDLDQGLVAE
jgi:hypothetical protein